MVPPEPPITTAIAEPKRPIGPTRPKDRIETIDILRGFALLGVILVNTWGFQNWSLPWAIQFEEVWTGAADHVAMWGITFFVEGRFYRLFSFLFGLGIGACHGCPFTMTWGWSVSSCDRWPPNCRLITLAPGTLRCVLDDGSH